MAFNELLACLAVLVLLLVMSVRGDLNYLWSSTWRTHLLHIKQLFTQDDLTELILFPDSRLPCPTFYFTLHNGDIFRCKFQHCPKVHYGEPPTSLMKIAVCLHRAKRTIDICMYKFTIDELAKLLIAKNKQKIRVRIITDNGREANENSQLPRLRQGSIEVREAEFNENVEEKYRPLMHNKFAIVDGKTCLLGSFNWTMKAVTRNNESVIKTSDATVVDPLMRKFEQMWASLEMKPQKAPPKTVVMFTRHH